MSAEWSENRHYNELHTNLKELKTDANRIKDLHWQWETPGKKTIVDEEFRTCAERIARNTSAIQNNLGIRTVTNLPTESTKLQRSKSLRGSFKNRNQRRKAQKAEKENTGEHQQMSCDDFHNCLKSLKAESIAIKKLYKETENKGKTSVDEKFRKCAERITFYSFQLQNRLGLIDQFGPSREQSSYGGYINDSSGYTRDPKDSYSGYTTGLDMERGKKRKRPDNSPEYPDDTVQKSTGSKSCPECLQLKHEVDRYYKSYHESKSANEDLTDKIQRLESDLHRRDDNTARVYQELENKKDEIQRLSKRHRESEESLRRTIDQLQNQLSSERKSKDEALKRLSASAGKRLYDNNPGITDLSDPNRPMKLAEQMSELYDNEWTTTLENMIDDMNYPEIKGVQQLLKILTDVYVFCEEESNKQFSGIFTQIVVPDVALKYSSHAKLSLTAPPTEYNKVMKDYRKVNWQSAVPLLQRAFKDTAGSPDKKMFDICKDYINKCIQLCWLMNVQDPPVHMEWNFRSGISFDTNKFRTYTSGGNTVDFVVWPILYLHRNGPMLSKGIAQGKKIQTQTATHSSVV